MSEAVPFTEPAATPTTTPPPAREAEDGPPPDVEKTAFYSVCQALCRLLTTAMFGLKVYGKRHVPARGGVLIVSNHQSFLDPILLGVQLRRPMSFMARSGLFTNRYFGWLIRNLNAFPVRQGAGDVGAIKETVRRLNEGHLLNIFPEGSRTEDGEIAKIEAGASLVIRRAGVPVVPAVIEGSWHAWPRESKVFRPYPVRVMFGPPLDLNGKRPAEITALIDRTLRELHAKLRRLP